MFFLIWLSVLIVSLLTYLWKTYSRFIGHGVKYLTPVPFLGNYGPMILRKLHLVEVFQKQYNAFLNERFTGFYESMTPVIMIRDPDLIKRITIRDFDHFANHRDMVDVDVDPLFGRSLFSLKGQEWKDMRSVLSPAFTCAKLRAMVPFMVESSDQMIRCIKNLINQTDSEYVDVDCKDLSTRSCNDIIASCGFGLKIDSHSDPENEFYMQGVSTGHFGFRRIMVYLGYSSFPTLMRKLNIKMFEENANFYFKKLFTDTIVERKQNDILRPDLLHLLMKAKKDSSEQAEVVDFGKTEESEVDRQDKIRSWSDTDLVTQAIFFVLANFESMSTAMCFMLYEMAVNTDVQDKLVKEITDNEANNEDFNYDSMEKLKYLDMVISELLRKWPFGVGMDRKCTKNYNLGKPNDNATSDYIIKKGELISVPVWALHRDPNHFPDPEKFDPERFSEKNRENIKPYTYVPFGCGPRICIASRYALGLLKVMLYQLLLHLEVAPAAKTRIPVKLKPGAVLLSMEGGHWIRFKLRK